MNEQQFQTALTAAWDTPAPDMILVSFWSRLLMQEITTRGTTKRTDILFKAVRHVEQALAREWKWRPFR